VEVRCDDDVSRGQDWGNNAGALVPASSLAVNVQCSAAQCFAGRRAGFSMAREVPRPKGREREEGGESLVVVVVSGILSRLRSPWTSCNSHSIESSSIHTVTGLQELMDTID
jgi:hypothetical protein